MDQIENSINKTAINGLAAVGFVALVVAGMWLAVYSTRFVPSVVNSAGYAAVYVGKETNNLFSSIASGMGSAAVYLGSVFNPAPTPDLSNASTTASTTISFGNASTTTATTTTTTTPKPVKPVAGNETNNVYQMGGGTTALYGLSDLVVSINDVGYLSTTSASSFIVASTVPAGSRPAVSFTIKNIGTNASGQWRFSATIPTQTSYLYQSQPQQSLNPGDSIDYVLGFDQANKGSGQMISVTANYDHSVSESNLNNNSASASVTILGN